MSKKRNILSLLACFFLAGCATIVGDATQLIPISSSPGGAAVVITDETGREVYKSETPTSVTLAKSDGSYWGGKDYLVKVTKTGYKEQTIPIASNPNGWYIAGNLAFGGLIGWFIVDPHSGDMYTLSPAAINADLGSDTAHNNRATDGSISIVLLEEVPLSLRPKMKRIN